jgi:hypothetical protein
MRLKVVSRETHKGALVFIAGLFIINACCAQMQSSSPDKSKEKTKSNKLGFGIKAGLNFANVTSTASLNNSSRTGFMAGIFLAPASRGVMGYRTELMFSRQGYDYKNNTNTGSVNLDYILFTHLFTINITKYVQVQMGALTAFLVSAKSDSTQSSQPPNPIMPYPGAYGKMLDYYNKFDYGATGGIEIHPLMGLLIGARYNFFFGDVYKMPAQGASYQEPSFLPTVNVKNNLLQVFIGYSF